MTRWLGIDPGDKGGLAVIGSNDHVILQGLAGLSERQVLHWLRGHASCGTVRGIRPKISAVMEKVGGYMPGSKGNIGSAMFTFGRSVGLLHGFLIATSIPYELIHPNVWQRALGIATRRKDESKPEFKRRLRDYAAHLFPNVVVTLQTADALLLAEYNRRQHTEGVVF